MKKLFIILGLGILLDSCSSQETLVSKNYTEWRCSDSPNCNIVNVHHHAW